VVVTIFKFYIFVVLQLLTFERPIHLAAVINCYCSVFRSVHHQHGNLDSAREFDW